MINHRIESESLSGTKEREQNDYGCWQDPPTDIMDNILRNLNSVDRKRLSIVCKSWGSVAMRRDIPCAPQLPWLINLPSPNCNYLSFINLSNDKEEKLRLPEPVEGGCFVASSKGVLVMIEGDGVNTEFFLLNPINGAQHQLPSITTVPSFQQNVDALSFITKIEVSSPNISECIVAATFNWEELGLCRPGDRCWTVFHILDNEEEIIGDILFSSCGKLYVMVGRSSGNFKDESIVARTLNFADDAVELKLLYDKREDVGSNFPVLSCLLESTLKKEVWLIHAIFELPGMNRYGEVDGEGDEVDQEGDEVDREGVEEDVTKHWMLSDCVIYKIDHECGNFVEIKSLGEETIFLATNSHPLSILASDFKKDLGEGNSIYILRDGVMDIFCLDVGKVLTCPLHPEVGTAWFIPSLW